MNLHTLIKVGGRFMLHLVGFYFATLVVLALLVPEMGKYQIICLSWLAGMLVALAQRRDLQRN